ncbi:MAG: EscU/YscU/HrcU family type III secretion system export apparatus switch protein [Edaphobacter sp.]|uniref:EscU/YscU/HrcU family type III secretion system export apparatus switch protein n=1 Tax=Edaphobacter sp. TaxID=1934404 RepID=UPI002381E70D|nr:EscU/YscU/HrcU family type III secretion system export apparatus switch protein [Edaphobacter sp.]MDE1178384.1 EscU/YscU/HrcU family type III secretion system export apparatus switch protein [Edaphobacter sp.]
MSDQKTEQATPQRKKKAKEQGDGVRSRDLLSALAMLGGTLVLGAMAPGFIAGWRQVYRESLRAAAVGEVTGDRHWIAAAQHLVLPSLFPLAAIMAASFGAALFGGIAQGGGVTFHAQALELKMSRLNPVENVKNLFSLRSATRLVKSLVPAAVMGALGWTALKELMTSAPVMSMMRLPATFSTAYGLALDAAWVTLAWSGLDYAMEWRAWNQRLRMSKQEIREESKEQMGNPEVKGRIRQIQRAMRKRKVKADMSRASVVITNPTHYAVALEFSFETMAAPVVIAKGRDLHAAEIREEARWAGIPLVENPPLARSLYRSVEPGQAIPFELYASVAGILAYLYRQKMEERMRRERQAEAARRVASARSTRPMTMYGFGGGV